MIAVSQSEMEIIHKIMKKHLPNCKVLAFGSRIKNTHYEASDLDLAIVGNEKIDICTITSIKEDFMESDIPYSVDVLDYHRVSESFRGIIDRRNVEIYFEYDTDKYVKS